MDCIQFPDVTHNPGMFPSLCDKTYHSDVRAAFGDPFDHTIGSLFQSFLQSTKDVIKDYITGPLYGFSRD